MNLGVGAHNVNKTAIILVTIGTITIIQTIKLEYSNAHANRPMRFWEGKCNM